MRPMERQTEGEEGREGRGGKRGESVKEVSDLLVELRWLTDGGPVRGAHTHTLCSASVTLQQG